MKTKTISVIAALSLLPGIGFAQPPMPPSPPNPPSVPIPPMPPNPPKDRDRDKMPKVPVTFLGVETSEVPRVVSEQLGLAKGFGLVVDTLRFGLRQVRPKRTDAIDLEPILGASGPNPILGEQPALLQPVGHCFERHRLVSGVRFDDPDIEKAARFSHTFSTSGVQ